MATSEALGSSVTVETLLGRPLNDVEERYAPPILYVKGTLKIPLPKPRVSIVGSRKASAKGLSDARSIANVLAAKEVVIVSGLAEGIDTAAHMAAMETGSKTIAVLGTPLNTTFPAKNFNLQQEIMRCHLAVSQFKMGQAVRPGNFVTRNRTMALISDATVIVEASNNSGSIHQGWEAIRLGRPLFIWKSLLNRDDLPRVLKMQSYGAIELYDPEDILEFLPSSLEVKVPNLLA